MSLSELINETCPICSDNLFLGKPGNPIEINTCHHKFHKDCLYRWCNSYQRNTLTSCSCPSCRQSFNFNNELNDLNETIKQDLLKALDNGDYNNLSPEDKNTFQKIIDKYNPVVQNENFLSMKEKDFAMRFLNASPYFNYERNTDKRNEELVEINRNAKQWLNNVLTLRIADVFDRERSYGIFTVKINKLLYTLESTRELILYMWNKQIKNPKKKYGDNSTPPEILNMSPDEFANYALQLYVSEFPYLVDSPKYNEDGRFLEKEINKINLNPFSWLQDHYNITKARDPIFKKMYENYIINQINQINQSFNNNRQGGKSKKYSKSKKCVTNKKHYSRKYKK